MSIFVHLFWKVNWKSEGLCFVYWYAHITYSNTSPQRLQNFTPLEQQMNQREKPPTTAVRSSYLTLPRSTSRVCQSELKYQIAYLYLGSYVCVCVCVCMHARVHLWWFVRLYSFVHVQLFCNPMACSPPGSSVHGISQARIQEWAAISSSRGSSWPRDQTHISCIARWFFTNEPAGKPWVKSLMLKFTVPKWSTSPSAWHSKAFADGPIFPWEFNLPCLRCTFPILFCVFCLPWVKNLLSRWHAFLPHLPPFRQLL